MVGGLDFPEEPETGLCLEGPAEGVSGTCSGLPADGGLSRSEEDPEFPAQGAGPRPGPGLCPLAAVKVAHA